MFRDITGERPNKSTRLDFDPCHRYIDYPPLKFKPKLKLGLLDGELHKTLKLFHHNVNCLLLRNAHKMTRQAALNGCTASEPVCVLCSR